MSKTTTLPKTVSRIAGLRSIVLTFFSILHLQTPNCLFVTDQWELGLSALRDINKGKFIGLKLHFFLKVSKCRKHKCIFL